MVQLYLKQVVFCTNWVLVIFLSCNGLSYEIRKKIQISEGLQGGGGLYVMEGFICLCSPIINLFLSFYLFAKDLQFGQ